MNLVFDESHQPLRVRLERLLTDDELLEFCVMNEPARVERDSNGELIVMSPNFPAGGAIEADVYPKLGLWVRGDGRGKTFGPNSGFTLPDTSVRAADAAWVSWARWNVLSAKELDSFPSS